MSPSDISGLLPVILTALSIGFLGSGHCVGMCGGIASALSFAIPEGQQGRKNGILLAYNIGRIASYAAMGALAGLLGEQLGGDKILRIVAGVLLIAMGLYLANWWRGLVYLEKAGSKLWVLIEPLGKRLLPVKSLPQALGLGLVWGWLPCGMVYSALAFAVAQGDPASGAAVMAAFGLGTLPAVFASGWAAHSLKNFLQKDLVRTLFAISIIAFGVWTLWMPLSHSGHGDHGGHGGHGQMDHGKMDHSQMNHGEMDHSKMDHSQMNHGEMDHSKMDHSEMDHSKMDHSKMDHSQMNHAEMDHSKMDHSEMNHAEMDHSKMDHSQMNHAEMDHSKMDHSKMDHGDAEVEPK